jgi:hypothetical protein
LKNELAGEIPPGSQVFSGRVVLCERVKWAGGPTSKDRWEEEYKFTNPYETNPMRRAFLTFSALGMLALLASAWPDIRRYWRISNM